MVDDSQEFVCQSDIGFAPAATALDTLIELLQVGAVFLGHERALHQCRSRQLVALLGDVSRPFRFVGVLNLFGSDSPPLAA